jgi:hypothetical protein
MLRILTAATFISTLALASVAQADDVKASAYAVGQSEAIVKLVSIDLKAHTAVVREPSGATMKINIPPDAQNLDRVKPGDLFKMRYVESLVVSLNKGGEATTGEIKTVELAPKGGTPGGKVTNTTHLTVVVQAIDRDTRTLTVQDHTKKVFPLKVAPEVRSFDNIAIGDTIGVTFTQALALEMVPQGTTPSPSKAAN